MWLIPTARAMPLRLMNRVLCGAIRQRLEHLELDRRRVAQEAPERLLVHDQHPHGARRRHGRVAWPRRDERHLAEERAVAEAADLPALGADVDLAVDEHEELVALPPLLDQRRARREAQLVRERRDLAQLALGATREERHPAEQFELRVLAQSHGPILTPVVGAPKR